MVGLENSNTLAEKHQELIDYCKFAMPKGRRYGAVLPGGFVGIIQFVVLGIAVFTLFPFEGE